MNDEQLFERAAAVETSKRDEVLGQYANDDQQIERVNQLLEAHQSSDSLLDTTAMQSVAGTVDEPSLPQSVGDFEVLGELGRGGMGVVYKARQKSLRREVALKVLSSGLGLSSKAILRFRREAEAAGKLHHTNIVPIYTTGEENGIHFYAMELIDGPSLDRVIGSLPDSDNRIGSSRPASERGAGGEGPKDDPGLSKPATSSFATRSNRFDDIAAKFAEVADALDHAHEHGVIHRDIKPSNLLLGPDGTLSINDFGLARMLEQPGMTMTGEFVGSPLYMSPEQIASGRTPIDHRTDIYSLGATLYEILTLQPPFPADSRDQVLTEILQKEPTSPRRLDAKIPLDLDTIVMKAIEKDPDKRYQSAAKLAEDLRAFVNRHAISARRLGPMGRAFKIMRRNPLATSFAGFVFIAVMTIAGLVHNQNQTRRFEQREVERTRLVEALMRGVGDETDCHIDALERLNAGAAELEFARGIQQLFLEDFDRAKEHLEPLLEHQRFGLSATSLMALAELWSGSEDRYFRVFDGIQNREPVTFEESLFLGYANLWNDPKTALKYLKRADRERPNFPVVRFLRGMATRYHVLLNVSGSEPKKRLQYLDEAATDIFSVGDTFKTPMTLMEQLSVRIMQSQALKRLAEQPDEADRRASLVTLSEQRADQARKLRTELIAFETDHVAQTAIALCHLALDDDAEFLRLVDRWFASDMKIINYAIQPILCRLLSLKKYDRAERWLSLCRGRTSENAAFLRFYVRLMSPGRSMSLVGLRAEFFGTVEVKKEETKRKKENAVYLAMDADLLHLLGYEKAWEVFSESEQQLGRPHRKVYSITHRYFGRPENERISPQQLIRLCETSDHPIYALSHAYFGLGIEAIASGNEELAERYFNQCLDQGCIHSFVYWISRAILANKHQWERWHEEREASLREGETP